MRQWLMRLAWSHPARWLFALVGGTIVVLGVTWLLESRPTAPIDSYAECVAAGYPVQESNPPVCRAAGHVFVGATDTPSPSAPVLASQQFQLLVDGDSHSNYPHYQDVITTPAQWERFWRDIHAGLPSPPPILPVDFATSNVVALSLGARATGGYHVKVTDILTSTAGTTVDVTETSPGERCAVTQSFTNPYYLVRTSRLPEPVTFRLTPEVNPCTIR
jgi:hypothetical protein